MGQGEGWTVVKESGTDHDDVVLSSAKELFPEEENQELWGYVNEVTTRMGS